MMLRGLTRATVFSVSVFTLTGCADLAPWAPTALPNLKSNRLIEEIPDRSPNRYTHPIPGLIPSVQPVEPLPTPREIGEKITPVLNPPRDAAPIVGTPPSVGGWLTLDEVLQSVENHYPLLRAIEQERAIAGGRLLTTMGAFDLNLMGGLDGRGGTYDNIRTALGVAQALPVGGLGLFAGYRSGLGEFPTYILDQKTADGGEFRAGVNIPLLRDREIDRPRAAVRQAQLDVEIAEPIIERQRLDFFRAASRTYWNWVAAGHRLRLANDLLRLAIDRDEQLKARVEIGPTANIERVDNQQNIALRNGLLVQAQRAFQQAAIELSLFLRDQNAEPTLPGLDRVPPFPPIEPVDPRRFGEALQTAFDLRPEPRRIRLQREKALVELRLASNQLLPMLNATVSASQDAGYGKSSLSGPNGLDRSSVNGGVALALPIQLRDARGRVQTAQALANQLEYQLRQMEDTVRAEVQDTFSALERAYEFYQQARQRVELARTVARAEREQLRLGRSDVLRVTLRETAAFEAEMIELAAQQDYFRALADFRAALGLDGRDAK